MKITTEHFELVKAAMNENLASNEPMRGSLSLWVRENQATAQEYLEYCRKQDTLNFARWEIFATCQIGAKTGLVFQIDTLYSYLNDTHIQTALNRIIPN